MRKVLDNQGDSGSDPWGTGVHSGALRNSDTPPAGWESDFGGKAQTYTRNVLIYVDFCQRGPRTLAGAGYNY